ncbi:MAG: DinB family protein [Chloroflexi bacterium]|nr:DinB family protein [Chloroflexota bacterium]
MAHQNNVPATISELFIRIALDRADLEAWATTLSEAQLSAPGKDGWAIKDHYVHLAVWEQSTAALLRHEPRYAIIGVQPGDPIPNETELNARIFAQSKDRSVDEALALFHSAHMELLNELAKLSDADLQKPFSHFAPGETSAYAQNPILEWLTGNTFEHYAEHIQWIGAMRNH